MKKDLMFYIYLRSKIWLSEEEASTIIGIETERLGVWLKKNNVVSKCSSTNGKSLGANVMQFSVLERALLDKLPKSFPYVVGNIKYSELMFCCFLNQTSLTRATCRVIPDFIHQDTFGNVLTERKAIENHRSVFERYGFYEEDGSKIEVCTHEFRHFWQTQLKKAGVSELIAAYAAGRADRNQNEAYDLRSPHEAADLSFDIMDRSRTSVFEQSALAVVHEVLGTSIHAESGRVAVISYSKDAIVSLDGDSGSLNVQGCHLTSYGICKHNYISSGCQKFMDCLDCEELLCIKGIASLEINAKNKAEELRSHLNEYRKQLVEDVGDGVEGADQWLVKTERQLEKLERLINDVYLNERIQNGTVVQLSADLKSSSALAQALIERLSVAIEIRDGSAILLPKGW